MNYYTLAIKKYFDFHTKSTRAEYWMFLLFNLVFSIVTTTLDTLLGITPILNSVYALFVLIPGISITFRRLHDIGRSGWWIFIVFIPLVGIIWFLVLMLLESKTSNNKYDFNSDVTSSKIETESPVEANTDTNTGQN